MKSIECPRAYQQRLAGRKSLFSMFVITQLSQIVFGHVCNKFYDGTVSLIASLDYG